MALCKNQAWKMRMWHSFSTKNFPRLFQSFRKTLPTWTLSHFCWQVTSALQLRLDEAFRSRSAGCCRCNLFAAKVRNATKMWSQDLWLDGIRFDRPWSLHTRCEFWGSFHDYFLPNWTDVMMAIFLAPSQLWFFAWLKRFQWMSPFLGAKFCIDSW